MNLKIILSKSGHKKDPFLGMNLSFKNELQKDKIKYNVYYIQFDKPNLIQRIFRLIRKKPIYLKRIDPASIRISRLVIQN